MTEELPSNDTTRTDSAKRLFVVSAVVLTLIAVSLVAVETTVGQETEETENVSNVEGTLGELVIRDTEQISDSEGQILVEWRGDTPTSIQHTQLDIDNERIASTDARLLPGEETRITVELVSNDPSLLWTEKSLKSNSIHAIRWSDRGSGRTVPLWQGTLFGMLTFALATGIMAWKKLNTYGEPQEGWT